MNGAHLSIHLVGDGGHYVLPFLPLPFCSLFSCLFHCIPPSYPRPVPFSFLFLCVVPSFLPSFLSLVHHSLSHDHFHPSTHPLLIAFHRHRSFSCHSSPCSTRHTTPPTGTSLTKDTGATRPRNNERRNKEQGTHNHPPPLSHPHGSCPVLIRASTLPAHNPGRGMGHLGRPSFTRYVPKQQRDTHTPNEIL